MTIETGNAGDFARDHRGWFVGHFMASEPLQSHDVEVKWGQHPAGEQRVEWGSCPATSLSVLVRGRFRLRFEEREVLLEREGDFALWGPGVRHSWQAEEDSLIISVRWPSRP